MADNKFGRYISGNFKSKAELSKLIKSIVEEAASKAVDNAVSNAANNTVNNITEKTDSGNSNSADSFEIKPVTVQDNPADDGYAKPQPIPRNIPRTAQELPHDYRQQPQQRTKPREQEQITFDMPEETVLKYINAYIPHEEPPEPVEPVERFPETKKTLTSEDKARAKFGEMRLIGRINYHGFVTSEAIEEVFVKQAKFMEDFTDDYEGNAFCGEFCPTYNNMTFAQLRTFFTWRVNARRGIYKKTDATYARLYAFELLNGIGTISQTDGMNRLIELWEKCRLFDNGLDYYMPIWIRDFYAFSDIEGDYTDFSDTFPVKPKTSGEECEIAERNYSKKLSFINTHSAYNYFESKFFECPYGKLAEDCLEKVLIAIDGYFAENGVSLSQLLVGRMKESRMWRPFRGAIYLLSDEYPNRTRLINPCERYTVKKGQWTYERLEVTAVYRNFNAYILKSIEAGLREKTAFRYSILPNLQLALGDFHTRPKVRDLVAAPEFTSLINKTVDEFFAGTGIPLYALSQKKRKDAEREAVLAEKKKPIKVEIDVEKLARIRAVSDELTRKLIVDEEQNGQAADDVGQLKANEALIVTDDIVYDEEQPYIEGMITGGSDDGAGMLNNTAKNAGVSADTANSADRSENISNSADVPNNTAKSADTSGNSETSADINEGMNTANSFAVLTPGWRAFAQSLSEPDFKVLNAFFGGNVYNECSRIGVMAEVVFEEINEKALDAVSDTVIENGELIPDYIDDIKEILKAKG